MKLSDLFETMPDQWLEDYKRLWVHGELKYRRGEFRHDVQELALRIIAEIEAEQRARRRRPS